MGLLWKLSLQGLKVSLSMRVSAIEKGMPPGLLELLLGDQSVLRNSHDFIGQVWVQGQGWTGWPKNICRGRPP